jgi:hypothetical protein
MPLRNIAGSWRGVGLIFVIEVCQGGLRAVYYLLVLIIEKGS